VSITSFIAPLALFCAIAYGLWDLFPGLNLRAGTIALLFVAAGVFNTWGSVQDEKLITVKIRLPNVSPPSDFEIRVGQGDSPRLPRSSPQQHAQPEGHP
jgi:hypothetical protein